MEDATRRGRSRCLGIVVLAVMTLLLPLEGYGQQAFQEKRVMYGFDREFPPMSYEREGKPAGFDIELLTTILQNQPVKLVSKPMNWENVLLDLSAGNIQISSGMIKTKQRLLLYNFSDRPLLPLKARLFTKNNKRIGNVSQLRGKRVSVKKGTLYEAILGELGGIQVMQYDTEVDALRALDNDLVEAFCGADRVTFFLLRKLNIPGISAAGTPLRVTQVYYAMNKDQKELVQWVNDGLRRVRESGEYNAIFRKWFVQELTEKEQAELLAKARQASINAYAPYSKVGIGAAVLGYTGAIYTGCTVENGLPGLSVGALQVAAFNAVSNGETDIRAAVAVQPNGRIASPSAEERRVLYEFGPEVLVVAEPEPGKYITRMVMELLPYPTDLEPQGQGIETLEE